MLSLVAASSGLMTGAARPAVQGRAATQMADISAFDNIWGFDAQKSVFDSWDPEKPRDYENFNPFERNLDGAKCDFNWASMQEEKTKLEALQTDPKWGLSGKPGCYS